MKLRPAHILILLLAALFWGCKRVPQYPMELLRIDSLCYVNPDSGLVQLENLARQMAEADEPIRNYYQLLLVKAHDKAFHKHSSANNILSVLRYYEKMEDSRMLPEAYYYAGRVMRDLGDTPQALDYFQKGLDALDRKTSAAQESNSLRLRSVIYAQMGYLLRLQHLSDQAIEAMKMTYHFDSINQDTTGMIISLCDIGQTYQGLSRSEEALHYYRLSEDLAKQKRDTLNFYASISQEAYALARMGRYQDAEERLSFYKNNYQKDGVCLLTRSIILRQKGETDSAAYYFTLLEKHGTKEQKTQAKLWLAKYELDKNHPAQAINKLDDFVEYSNSVHKQENSEAIGLANALYNYQLREKENSRLQMQHSQDQQAFILAIASAIILSIVIIILLYQIRKNRGKVKKQQKRLQLLHDSIVSDAAALEENELQIKSLRQQLKESAYNCESLQKELNDLVALNLQNELAETFDQRWRTTEEYLLINAHIADGNPLLSEEWAKIEAKVRLINPLFISRLRSVYDFSEIEWRISVLIRLHVTPTNMAILTSRTYAAIANARKRLYKKVTQKDGTTEDWDKFIMTL